MKKIYFSLLAVLLIVSCSFAQKNSNSASENAVDTQIAAPVSYFKTTSFKGNNNKSLSGSYVEFAPIEGGDAAYLPSTTQQFMFYTYAYSPDWEYVYNVWLKFPDDWTVTNVEVHGTPGCGAGSYGTFAYTLDAPNIANIAHVRYMSGGGDWCGAYYLVTVTTGANIGDANVSWYYDGDGYGGDPHWPCSSDGFTPSEQQPCNEMINPPAVIPFGGDIAYLEQFNIADYHPAQNFEPAFGVYNCIAADDFTVTGTWDINRVVTRGEYSSSGPLNLINIHFYQNNAGLPGTLITEFLAIPCQSETKSGMVTVDLPSTVTLTDGTYWVGIAARMDYGTSGQWFINGTTSTNGNPSAWINPVNGFGTGATSWTYTNAVWGTSAHDLALGLYKISSFTPSYLVTFSVTDGINPVEGAVISVVGYSDITTNTLGLATIYLEDGTYNYSVSATNFEDLTGQNFTVNGSVLTEDVVLTSLPQYTVTFTVTDGANPFENATVNVVGEGSVLTNASGLATFNLYNGTYDYMVSASGFIPQTGNFNISGANLPINIVLNPLVISPTIYEQHELVTHPGQGFDGYDSSALQNTSLGMGTIGFGFQIVNNNSIADDFTVPAGEIWTVDGFNFFAYQTGSTTTSTITDVRLRIYDGAPNSGGTIIANYWTGGVMAHTQWSGIYRTQEGDIATATNRPLMLVIASINELELTEGTYWVEVSMAGSLGSGPWCAPRTILGETATGNALQNISGTWQNLNDGGTAAQQGLPFDVLGKVVYNVTINVSNGTDPIENAEITVDGQTLYTDVSGVASIDLANGTYSYVVSAVDYHAETGDFTVADGVLTVDIILNEILIIYDWPTASDITYGQSLASSTLSGGSTSVPGVFLFDDESITPFAGVHTVAVTFFPDDDIFYETVSGTVNVTVNKATPIVNTWPVASDIYYTQSLASSSLTGGNASVPGMFTFNDSSIEPAVGTYTADVTFTPNDGANNTSVTSTVEVVVNQAETIIVEWPTASNITYEESLASSTLTGGIANTTGIFTFEDDTVEPSAGLFIANVIFTPDDSGYETVFGTIEVYVDKADPIITLWPVASDILIGQSLASSVLSGGVANVAGQFEFNDETIIPPLGLYIADITFYPANIENYNEVNGFTGVSVIGPPVIAVNPSSFNETLASGDIITRPLTVFNNGDENGVLNLSIQIIDVEDKKEGKNDVTYFENNSTDYLSKNTDKQNPGLTYNLPQRTSKSTDNSILYINAMNGLDSEFVTLVQGLPNVGAFENFNAIVAIPSADYMSNYDMVILSSNNGFADNVLLGNNLAEYVDNGGAVCLLQGTFSLGGPWALSGAINSPDYLPLSIADYTQSTLTSNLILEHPITQNVTSISTGIYSHSVIQGDGVSLGEYPGGYHVAAFNSTKPIVSINAFPQNGFWGGDLIQLMQNTIDWLSIPKWLSIDETEFTINGADSHDFELTFDATDLYEGVYEKIVRISSNDPSNPVVDVPVTMTITGTPDITVSNVALAFGNTNAYFEHVLPITITNTGTADLEIFNISCGTAEFSASNTSLTIGQGSEKLFITFYSENAGLYNDVLTFETNVVGQEFFSIPLSADISEYEIILAANPVEAGTVVGEGLFPQGEVTVSAIPNANYIFVSWTDGGIVVSEESNYVFILENDISLVANFALAPTITVNPEFFDEYVNAGDVITRTLTINNIGDAGSELIASLSVIDLTKSNKTALNPELIEGVAASGNPFNFENVELEKLVPSSNLIPSTKTANASVLYVNTMYGNDITFKTALQALPNIDVFDELNVGEVTPNVDYLLGYDIVIVAILNPMADAVLLGNNLAEYVDNNGSVIILQPSLYTGGGFTLAGNIVTADYSPLSLAGYAYDPSTCTNFIESPFTESVTSISCVYYSYASVQGDGVSLGTFDNSYPVAAYNSNKNVLAVNVVPLEGAWGGDLVKLIENAINEYSSWLSIDNNNVTIAGGDSFDVELTFDATNLFDGVYEQIIRISSNDASNPIVDVPVTLTVTGFPEILVSIDPLDFGVIAIDTEETLNVVINNTGTADLIISDIATSDASFTASVLDLTIPPKESRILQVTFVSSVGGIFNADLTFTTNDILNENILIEMLAEVKAPPAISVDPASLYQKLAENESAQQILTITNSGDLPLEFSATYNLNTKEIKKEKLERTIVLGESSIIAENHPDKPALNVEQCIKYNKGVKADLNVLIYEDVPDFYYYTAALQELGYTYTSVNSWFALNEALIMGVSWDLVIVNSYNDSFNTNALNELNNLIIDGKKVVFAHWESIASHPISVSFGINVINVITTPINFSINAEHNILTTPNVLPSVFSWTHNQYNADGQIVELVGGAKRLAIYDGYPNSAAIVLNESENAIFNAFQAVNFSTDSNGSGKMDIQELIENQITLLTKSIVAINPNAGIILPGESAELIVTFDSEDLEEGIYEGNITITSNDPINPEIIVPTVLEVEFTRHTITATAEPNGSISPAGEVLVIEGTDQLFNITPDVGYHVVDVIVDATSIGTVADYTFVNVLENHTIHAAFAINTYTATASATAGGTINPLGVTIVEHGSSLTYNVIPDVGYHIADVLVNTVSQGVIYDYTFENITDDVSIHAIFEINNYNIAIAANPVEGGNVFGAGIYPYGYNVIATAVANGPDYVFANWTENGAQVSTNAVYEFIATSDRNLVANFGEIGQFNVALFNNPANAGLLSGGGSYDVGAEVTIEATPIFGFVFDGWTGYETTTENPFVFTMPSENINFTANFSVATYEIIATAGEFGSIDPAGTIVFEHGDNQTYTMIPEVGYHVEDVLVDGVSVGAVESYTFNNITDNHSIHASFAIDVFEIIATAGPGGSINPEGSNLVEYDSELSFSIIPDEGYIILDVEVDGISQGPIDSYTFEFINDNHTIHAEFEAIDYTLTVLIDPVDVGEVSINPDSEFYNIGDEITLIASANEGFLFFNWTIEGSVISTNTTLEYIMPANDVVITANFIEDGRFLVSVEIDPVDGGYVEGEGPFYPEETVTLEAFSNPGFLFIAWELDGSVVETSTTYEFTMPEEDVLLIARFEAILYELTVVADPIDGGIVSGSGEYVAGEEINVSASPSYGWEFINWTVAGVEVSVNEDFIYTMPFENVTLVANFSELPEYIVSVTVDPIEGGTITGEGTYYLGEEVILTANANIGYSFIGWEEEGSIIETATTFEFVMPNNNVDLVALFEINIHTLTVVANPVDGGNVSGSGDYTYGEIIPVSAVAEVGYNFVYWSVDGNVVSTEASFDYMMPDNDVTLIANFVVEGEYLVVVEIQPEEGGTVTGTGSYLPEAEVTLEATSNEGFVFVGWELEGEIIETQAIYEFMMPETNVFLVAQFEAITYQLTLVANPVEGGELFGAGDYIPGEMISISAVAAEGYTFVNWSLGLDIISEDADFNYTMPEEDITLVALFEINVHTLTLVANPVGGGTVVGGGDYEFGTSVEVTATPAVDYQFDNWTIGGTVISNEATFNYVMPDNDVTLTANFSEVTTVTYTLIVVADPVEGGSVSGGGNYEAGEEVTVNATPAEGYDFEGWYLEETLLSEDLEYTFDMPAEDLTLTAAFTVEPGINDNDLASINMYPNPSKGKFSVESDRVISEIKVINMIGKVVHTESSDSKIVELSLSGLDPGTYFVVVFTEKGQSTLKMQIAK